MDNLIDSHDNSNVEVEDTFGLEFAAVQWLKLVTNAEELFNNLLQSILLSGDEKEQIQRWLCLKQECEECVASEAASLGEHHRHSLERIEELAEDTEHTEDLSDINEKSTDSQYESETESDFDSNHPDFEDKLDVYMERFRDKTDMLIQNKLAREDVAEDVEDCLKKSPLYTSSSTNTSYQNGRRRSLHPGSIQAFMTAASAAVMNKENGEGLTAKDNSNSKQNDFHSLSLLSHGALYTSIEPYKELKLLSTENDAKKSQIKQVVVDIEGAHKRMKELQQTIQIKEQFIKELIKNNKTRASAKLKFEKKWGKLQEVYYKTRTQLAQAESALHETRQEGAREALVHQKNEVKKYKNLARHYEKRLKDIDMMKEIAKDSAKKVVELEKSLFESMKQKEKLEKQLVKEEEHKYKLEQELVEDQQKMRALEEKYNLQVSKLLEKEKTSGHDSGDDRLKWIAEETERLTVMRESSNVLHLQLLEQKSALDKREAIIKEKVDLEKQRTKNIMEVNARISHLENILKEKSLNLENPEDKDDKEAHRQEIRNLRKTRDCLLDQRNSLDEKYQKDQTLSSTEERTRLECEEAIEAIDATIEYKNQLICGRKSLGTEELRRREEGEQMLMDRLLKLSTDEMRTLLYKYFQKVIDLKENGKKLEQQIDELENQTTNQTWQIQDLTHALQAQRLEAERQKVDLQRHHQEKLHLMLRQFAEESGSSGTEAGRHLVVARDSELNKYKRENKHLKRRLQEVEALMQAAAASRGVRRIRSRSTSPEHNVLQPLPAPASTTKMIRERNKVIISLNAPKKKSTNKDLSCFNQHK